ncbi:MAG: kynureninase [candidate division KSB1 bacterium]|nr:kynureninase [candidate division KSB1 bacterium]MDZ7302851.1 kynureninase [candidate division KSB1 bacterium]MDZ7311868.1 kynureninase [candidate division KSB1 bacterium]
MATAFRLDQSFALQMDSQDPLAAYRDRFYIPQTETGEDCIYLCGNSLGLQPKTAAIYVEQILKDWELLGVEAHFRAGHPWITYHELLTESIARLVGAKPIEVVVMNALTVNLHLMMVSFYRPTSQRHKILIEANAFPSDQYAVKSQLAFHGFDPDTSLIEISPRPGERIIRIEDIESLIAREGDSIALIMLAGVQYATGQAFEMARIVRAGHAKGCVVGFDLAHAVGNVILQLHDWDVDFAVWCSYKYLNGGPGSPAGCFVHERYANDPALPRLAGWWGHDKPTRFLMGPVFHPIPGAEGWQVSNQPILSLAALRAAMEIFDEVGIEKIRAKSVLLTGYLDFLLERHPHEDFSIITPRQPEHRGAQLSISIRKHGRALCEKLSGLGVICDWREPDILRVAPVPLYNSFLEVYRFVEIFNQVLSGKDT